MQLIGFDDEEAGGNASMAQFLGYVAALEPIVGGVAVRKEVAVPGVRATARQLLEPEELSTAAQIGPHLDFVQFPRRVVFDDWSTHFDLSCDLTVEYYGV
jgi:hypothetical protein